ncbi:TIGR02281 family clan AA aspartic protease [Rhodobacterales bacterium HKCCE3408]|nr:TIGR02281 family clan AA aspartic protease [Rhodobacterales bacterium HKCCE3408]
MQNIDLPSLVYLGLFLVVIGGSYLVSQRKNLGRTAQYAAIWGLIFLGAILAVGAWEQIRGIVAPQMQVIEGGAELRVPQSPDGHFYVTAQVNGNPIRFVVDTGATDLVLRREDAEKAGIDTEALVYSGMARTANGTVSTAPVVLDTISLGPVEDRGVLAVVNDGDMPESLLGMGYLNRFATISMGGGQLVLTR